ncbi:MAG TPA: HAMP domain-containing sensor histidine kinase [Mobilitalea sp.]|nr:HAMP domain-containing sensor histidine kinase [Mobilitalea sp.]
MSIKTKIPILTIIMLLLNTAALLIYYNFYFYQEVAGRIKKISGVTITEEILRENKIVQGLIKYELIMISLLIVLIGLTIHIFYSRPLYQLNKTLKDYRINTVQSTDRKDEIGQLQNSFAQLFSDLSEEKHVQNKIINCMSRDIKIPISSVLEYSEDLMKMDLSQENTIQYLEVIYSKARDIEEILQDFDAYVEGKLSLELNKQNYRLTFLEEMLKKEYEQELEQNGVGFEIMNLSQLKDEAALDLVKIRRVFANLITNSVRHNKGKNDLRIVVTMDRVEEKATFCVADNGGGISYKDIPYIFEPFYISDNGHTMSGLGLPICKNIVEAHAGEMWVDTHMRKGFAVWFNIP